MNSNTHSWTFLSSIFLISTTFIQTIYSEHLDEKYRQCSLPFNCGNIGNLSYPFSDSARPQFCGHRGFELICPDNNTQHPLMKYRSLEYQVLSIDNSQYMMRIQRTDLSDICSLPNPINTTLNTNIFDYLHSTDQILYLLYNCTDMRGKDDDWQRLTFRCRGREGINYFVEEGLLSRFQEVPKCETGIRVPVLHMKFNQVLAGQAETEKLQEAVNSGFFIQYQKFQRDCTYCKEFGGVCGSDHLTGKFSCLCPNKPYPLVCRNKDGKWKPAYTAGIFAGLGGIFILAILFCFHFRRKRIKYVQFTFSKDVSTKFFEVVIEKETPPGLHIFSYDELETATNKFNEANELGNGGFGTVYYGKLQDGRAVAVKRLHDKNYKRGFEQFMNEIAILSRLCHQNLVTLYGCSSRESRELLLVYEFVPNGTVADHLHGERAKSCTLPWSTRMKIATETASALVYLHASDIVHRDVKTNNILLESDFRVKVADFGLSRLIPIDVAHITTLPQGTPGYLDPEYHDLCQLTDKSDVYSFGVVLMELISSKLPVDMTRNQNEISLANMALNRISKNELHEIVDRKLGYESDQKVRTMIDGVAGLAFTCLQKGRETRPSMAEVLHALRNVQRQIAT